MICSCGVLLGLGDGVQQGMELRWGEASAYDWHRTGRMVVIGFAMGPLTHWSEAPLLPPNGCSKSIAIRRSALMNAVSFTLSFSALKHERYNSRGFL